MRFMTSQVFIRTSWDVEFGLLGAGALFFSLAPSHTHTLSHSLSLSLSLLHTLSLSLILPGHQPGVWPPWCGRATSDSFILFGHTTNHTQKFPDLICKPGRSTRGKSVSWHLKFGLLGAGALREDLQDQLRPVQHLANRETMFYYSEHTQTRRWTMSWSN